MDAVEHQGREEGNVAEENTNQQHPGKTKSELQVRKFVAVLVFALLAKIKAVDFWGIDSTAMYTQHLVYLAMEKIAEDGFIEGHYPRVASANSVAKYVLKDLNSKFGDLTDPLILMRDPVMKMAIIRSVGLHVFLYSEWHKSHHRRHQFCRHFTKILICLAVVCVAFVVVRYIPPIENWGGSSSGSSPQTNATVLSNASLVPEEQTQRGKRETVFPRRSQTRTQLPTALCVESAEERDRAPSPHNPP